MEGLARGDVGPFEQNTEMRDGVSYRDYYDGKALVMRMTTFDKGGTIFNAKQVFEIDESVIAKTSYIYIPTDDEYELWDEMNWEQNRDVASEEIAKKEGRIFVPPVRKPL